MPIPMDEILRDFTDEAHEVARLGRNGVQLAPEHISAKMLAELECSGDAMRFVDARGRIAWKATPTLSDHLMGLERDAQDDFQDVQ
jgi:hypothetical protein